MSNAWDQLDNEPTEAHARFLVYRNLGPVRTVEAAYHSVGKSRKKNGMSGQWASDSAAYNWRERAARWDVAQLNQIVPETAGIIFEGIKEYARIVLRELQSAQYKPRNWAELRDSLVVLAGFVSPEVITQAVDNSAGHGDATGQVTRDDNPNVAGDVPQP